MRPWLLAVCAVAGLAAGCGGRSPVTFCNDFAAEVCAREFECQDDATKQSAAFIQTYGANQAECDSKLKSNTCATVTNDKPCADSTIKYHPDKADSCISDLKAASCQTIVGASFTSGNCDNVCS
jgi:hypothetical protein